MNVKELYGILSEAYPAELSCGWDNDGLMAAVDLDAPVRKVLISLDATESAVKYAAEHGFDVLLTHHPMIFKGAKHVTPMTLDGRRILAAITGGVTVMSFHTRLDAVEGGVNDELCRVLGFESDGVFGDEEAPTLGRLATLREGMTLRQLAVHVKEKLNAPSVKLIAQDTERVVTKIALCGGGGKGFTYAALAAGAEAFITGENDYNTPQDASELGLATIEAGHYETEVPVCRVLADKLTSLGIPSEMYRSCVETVF